MSAIARNQVFSAVHTVGGLLPADMLVRISEGKDVSGCKPADYRIAGSRSVRDEAERHWDYLKSLWTELRTTLPAAPETDLPADPTRSAFTHWLAPLFDTLGFGVLTTIVASGITSDDESKTFPISHRWNHVPVHLTAWNSDLDKRPGGAGTVPAQSLVQECLNRTDAHLWGVVTNGRQLRLLRDSSALATASYVEFDLESIFDGELFSEFVLLYRLLHVSRFATAESAAPSTCWLEKWRVEAIASGTRALDQLRDGVQKAITILGTGFLRHPDNTALRANVDVNALHQALLRLVYRLLFAFVAEDRDALHHPTSDAQARTRYATYFSTTKLRAHARRRRGTAHHDLYESLQVVLKALGDVNGRPELGLPGLGGIFDPTPADELLRDLRLSNDHLLAAVRHLSQVFDTGAKRWRSVDYQHLDAEELGSIYESLLELIPRHSAVDLEFELVSAAGNARKTTGSYYTPSSLIELLLDSALDPVIDDAVKRGEVRATAAGQPDPAESIADELLSLTVCDPACGSGHFLVAAARRIAKRVAAVREGNPEPTLPAVRTALHEVIARCIYGVDLNPMAVELAKVSLWLEALEPGKPLGFLDAHIKCGNALIGVTPALLRNGIPDVAFKAIEGDDKRYAKTLERQNTKEREGQFNLFDLDTEAKVSNTSFAAGLRRITGASADTLADVRRQESAYRELAESEEYVRTLHVADAWCAAFLWRKTPDAPRAITEKVFRDLQDPDADAAPQRTHDEITRLRVQYRFFHWHLEFPDVFAVPDNGAPVAEASGWAGGFDCVLGNPPWERIKLQEQEFFAQRDERIATARNAAARKNLIGELKKDPDRAALYLEFEAAKRKAEGESHFLRNSNRYPLTGRGDINTYAVFSETDRTLGGPRGRMGVIVPTGIATDDTTKLFFQSLTGQKSLVSLFDFRNAGFFGDVAGAQGNRFCLLTIQGELNSEPVDMVFRVSDLAELHNRERHVMINNSEIRVLNPNTGTVPIFRSRRDAEITLDIYRRVPILISEPDEHGHGGSNPWRVSFMTMFHMANDAHLFRMREDLEADDWTLNGNVFARETEQMLPLYEAKMLHHYTHRFGDYALAHTTPGKGVRAIPTPSNDKLDHPDYTVEPRYWVDEILVRHQLDRRNWDRDWLIGWRDIASSLDERTMICFALPVTGVGHKAPLILIGEPGRTKSHLLAILSSFCLDYIVRQKVGGTSVTYFYVKQLPIPTPDQIRLHDPFISPRVLELTHTTRDMAPFARDLGDTDAPFRWSEERRAVIRAELDALFFHLYGISRADTAYILDTFPIVKRKDEATYGTYRTKELILAEYDRMAAAGVGPDTPLVDGENYTSTLIPRAGHGPRHTAAGANT